MATSIVAVENGDDAAAEDTERSAYTASRPFINVLEYESGDIPAYDRVSLRNGRAFRPQFAQPAGLTPTASNLSEVFLPDELIDEIATQTSSCARARLPPSRLLTVGRAEMLQFFAMYYYMGLVRLPSKCDYWRDGELPVWPHHPITAHITWRKFDYIWENMRLTDIGSGLVAEEVSDLDREDNDEENLDRGVSHERWLAQADPIVEHLNTVSKIVCQHPGFACAVGEQMKRYKRHSSLTHRTKNAPIKEGFKFFAINCAATGYVYHFIPHGGGATVETLGDTVGVLIESLPRRDELQYVVAVEDLFTTRQVMVRSRQLKVAVIGTARRQRDWPPPEIKNVLDDRFNSLYLLRDPGNFLIGRWIDSNVVTMATTIHTGNETVTVSRDRPRATNINRHHIHQVWGSNAVTEVQIPAMINDYNRWMVGIDKSELLIAYCRPDLRCQPTWMPIMLHCLDILRSNAFIAYQEMAGDGRIEHKEFLAQWIASLLDRATSETVRLGQQPRCGSSPSDRAPTKRRRTSSKNPSLPSGRVVGGRSVHLHVRSADGKQRACTYCSYSRAIAKSEGVTEDLPVVSRVIMECSACNVRLCRPHFDVYHGWNDNNDNVE